MDSTATQEDLALPPSVEEGDAADNKAPRPFEAASQEEDAVIIPPSQQQQPTDTTDTTTAETSNNASLSYRQHTREVLSISGPIIISEIFQNTLPIVDIAFVGRLLSKEDLAAAALATVWFNLWNTTMMGFMTAIDTLLSQSYGAGKYAAFRTWTGTSLIVVFWTTIVVAGLISLCGPFMKLLGQDPNQADEAALFSYRLLPGIFPYYLFKVLVKYLQTQDILWPGVYVGICANGFNILFNWLLIDRWGLGIAGAPWATTLTRLVEFLLVLAYLFWAGRHQQQHQDPQSITVQGEATTTGITAFGEIPVDGDSAGENAINTETQKATDGSNLGQGLHMTWPIIFSKEHWMSRTQLRPFRKLAVSGALSIAAEAWSFEITTILAGLLGTVPLDAHIITLSIATFIFLSFPFAIGIAASIRVGQLTGDGQSGDAQRSCAVSMGLATIVQAILVAILWPCSGIVGELFSSDEEVAALVRELIPLSCIFMMGDAIQAVTGGTLRGLGLQTLNLFLNILGFWLLAVPVGSTLTFSGIDMGVQGIWWGFVVGIYASAFIGLVFLKFRIDWNLEATKASKRISAMSTFLVGELGEDTNNDAPFQREEVIKA